MVAAYLQVNKVASSFTVAVFLIINSSCQTVTIQRTELSDSIC